MDGIWLGNGGWMIAATTANAWWEVEGVAEYTEDDNVGEKR